MWSLKIWSKLFKNWETVKSSPQLPQFSLRLWVLLLIKEKEAMVFLVYSSKPFNEDMYIKKWRGAIHAPLIFKDLSDTLLSGKSKYAMYNINPILYMKMHKNKKYTRSHLFEGIRNCFTVGLGNQRWKSWEGNFRLRKEEGEGLGGAHEQGKLNVCSF